MELKFKTYVAIGNENNYDNLLFTVDYDCTREDFEEFAKSEGYKDLESLLKDHSEDLLDSVETILSAHEFTIELAVSIECGLKKELHDFLVAKYQTEFENRLLSVAHTIDTDGINLNY